LDITLKESSPGQGSKVQKFGNGNAAGILKAGTTQPRPFSYSSSYSSEGFRAWSKNKSKKNKRKPLKSEI
jgi:hypothetical protein